jgi:ATP-binding cassette, subfamily B, bacterial HlyB/CyaB
MSFNVTMRKTVELLSAISRHHGEDVSPESIMHLYAVGSERASVDDVVAILRKMKHKAKAVKTDIVEIKKLIKSMPILSWDKDGEPLIIISVKEKEEKIVVYYDQKNNLMSDDEFTSLWCGICVLSKKIFSITDEQQPFSLQWFIPQLLKEKGVFRDVAIISFVLNLTALCGPLYFQLLIDKVLTHHSYTTLQALSFGFLIVMIFEVVYNFLKRFLLVYATRKIDFRLERKTFQHLSSLSIDFFDVNPSGVLLKHTQQTGKIRGFLTGKVFMTLLDSTSLFIMVPFLWMYSPKLTGIVIGFSIIIGALLAVAAPYFKKKLKKLYIAEGERQANLVEMITGMRTVKSLAIEPVQIKKWDRLTSETTLLGFDVGNFSNKIQSFSLFMQKALVLVIPWLGADLVISGAMSVGALVAFNMMAGRVSGPLVQLVTIISDAQEIRLSIEMLGNIMNARPERLANTRGLMPKVRGNISIQNVTFRYPGANSDALINANLTIGAGVSLGIVGKSGSGKSTLARIIQGLYIPQAGLVQIDGLDIREIDLPHLRKSIGIVLQENYYFRGTVRENIALTKQQASFEEIVAAAILAGADEFIKKLPQGYDTMLRENASNLSGGQKQRLAIARALLTNPSILVMDEATSALDAESEAIIQENITRISQNRTVIIISHRLSILSNCTKLLVMNEGKFIDLGTHDELMTRCLIYRDLWLRQNKHLLVQSDKGLRSA